ncbi:cell filamentation protein Fic, partial [Streptomyces sp. NPDC089915]
MVPSEADRAADPDRMADWRFTDRVTALLVSRYGRWACGWDHSNHFGGPVETWCCPSHSVAEARDTAERVVTCLLEWRDWLEDLAERFERL